MKIRVLLTTLVSLLLLAAVIAAGLNAVFTVTLVRAEFEVASDTGRAEAAELKEKLDGFIGRSSTFLDLGEVRAVVAEYPCMRVERLEKKFPSVVEIDVTERNEAFAVQKGEKYSVFSEDGLYLYDKEDASNRTGGQNIVLENFTLIIGEDGMAQGEHFGTLLTVYNAFEEVLKESRANVRSIAYRVGVQFDSFYVTMQEGICIEIVSPDVLPAEKAKAALTDARYGYLNRPDHDRVGGLITVLASGDTIIVNYDFTRG